MTNVSSSNTPHADTALLTVPQQTSRYDSTDESVFLTQQAADAQIAMRRTVADMQATVKQVVNVRWWTQHYPWYAVGAVVVVGFIATTQVLAPTHYDVPPAPLPQRQAAVPPSWISSLVELVSKTLVSTLLEALRTRGQQSAQARNGSSSAWSGRHTHASNPS